jgi:hypothetical protein
MKTQQSQRQEEQIAQHHLLPELSPFQAGRTHPTAEIRQTVIPGIGFVTSVSVSKDDEGNRRYTEHLVGIACRHWAPSAETTGDCRFGCLRSER